jgi:hypothetical protein
MVIYIHGIGELPPKEQWKQQWDLALFGKPMGDQTSMAYWSDILHGPATIATRRARAVREQAGGQGSADEIDLDAILEDASIPVAKRREAAARLERIAEALAGVDLVGGHSGAGRGTRARVLPRANALHTVQFYT